MPIEFMVSVPVPEEQGGLTENKQLREPQLHNKVGELFILKVDCHMYFEEVTHFPS